jgi:putative alpha-1,2-mannosidase
VDFKGDGYDLGKPHEHGVWFDNSLVKDTININQVYYGESFLDHDHAPTPPSIPFYSFEHSGFLTQLGTLTFAPNPNSNKPTSILARVGVSFISPEQACSNAESEIPNFDFAGTQARARAQWDELLSRVQVGTEGVYKEIVELFYSSVGSFGGSDIYGLGLLGAC